MSKGTIRLPASAITGGRVGTARIRDEIAGAARELADTMPTPLDATMRALAGALATTPDEVSTALRSTAYPRGLTDRDEAFGMPPGTAARIDAVRAKEIASFVAQSPMTRMQQLGRQPRGRMNKTEAAYAQLLEARRTLGEIREFKFESVKLRLADRTWYTPDFCVYLPCGSMEIHEVKGFMTDDANVKLKVAAETFRQHLFRLVRKGKKGTWTITTISAR